MNVAAFLRGRVPAAAVAAPPTVGPGVNWNGTALSGGSPPVNTPRVAGGPASPAMHWWQPSELRFVGLMVIGVDADALGGVAYVDFWVEGNVQRVTRTLYVDTDVNGKTRKRLGYFITVRSGDFTVVGNSGAARVFATAHPNDATMQDRTIGTVQTFVPWFSGDRQMLLYPRTFTAGNPIGSDFVKTVGTVGDYATLQAALDAAHNAGAEAPWITLMDTGAYELADSTVGLAGTAYTTGKAFAVITHAQGATATLGRAAFPTGKTEAQAQWFPRYDGLEFRGSGIVIDFKNFTAINNVSKAHRFNGCTFTNSIGTRDSYYWNRGSMPGNNCPLPCYFEDCTARYCHALMSNGQIMVTGCNIGDVIYGVFEQNHFIANTFLTRQDNTFYTGNRPNASVMTMGYSGASAAATMEITGDDDAAGNVFKIYENGVLVDSLALGRLSTDANFLVSSVITWLNSSTGGTRTAGWAAAAIDSHVDDYRASGLHGHGFGGEANTGGQINAKGVTLTLDTFVAIHSELSHHFNTDTVANLQTQNIIWRNLTCIHITDTGTAIMLMENGVWDFAMEAVAISGLADNSSPTSLQFTGNGWPITGSIDLTGTLTVTVPPPNYPLGPHIAVGQYISGPGVTFCQITALGTGVGGTGTYTVSVPQTVSSQVLNNAFKTFSHCFGRNSVLSAGPLIGPNDIIDAYCDYSQCVFWKTSPLTGAAWPAFPTFRNCLIVPTGTAGMPNNAGSTGNINQPFNAGGFGAIAMFVDYVNGDMRAMPGKNIAANLMPKIADYDRQYNLRAASDWIGPDSVNSAAFVAPF